MSRLHLLFAPGCVGLASRWAIALCCISALPQATYAITDTADIVPGERLSAWLQRQRIDKDSYLTGLEWYVPEEKSDQQALKDRLTQQLYALRADKAPTGISLARWLRTLPITGRAVVSNPDDRWLEANPEQDPVLHPGQRVKLPQRPTTATVVLDDGALCQVPYRAGVLALDYLRSCVEDPDQRDTVWVAQPDGRTFRYGIGVWNAQAQQAPAAGAWIWAPSRSSSLPEDFSDDFILLLATQGLAADGAGRPVGAPAEAERAVSTSRSRDLPLTASDWGEVGLLQTPTARMARAGEARLTISHIKPYTRVTTMLQPLDWLEGGFRYSDISNQLYDPTLTISSQSYKDKSVDAKVRLWKESRWIPEIAIGARDLGGTGLFSSEYVVANKRRGDFDFSAGLGWGYLGSRGNIKNPLSLLSDQFNNRPGFSTTGTTNNKAYFRGPTSLFGGVQWQTPIQPLVLKLEYDGNAYKHEPFDNSISERLPINVGFVYRYSPNIDLTAAVERGNSAMLSVTLHGGLDALASPKIFDVAAPVVNDNARASDPAWMQTASDIQALTGWTIDAISRYDQTLLVTVSAPRGVYLQSRLDRLVAVLNRDAPHTIKQFTISFAEHGLGLGEKTIRRSDWVALHNEGLSPAQKRSRNVAFIDGPLTAPAPTQGQNHQSLWTSDNGRLRGGLSPSLWQSLGGPDSFLLYQLGVQGAAEYRVTNSTWVTSAANMRLVDNYDKFQYTAPSSLPRVRTYVREYVTTSRFTLNNLQINHAEQLSDNNFMLVYGGLLESMYGGLGGEYMYRRRASPLAFGVDVNRVRQRGFAQHFDFRDYDVTTGHATLYWDTGWKGIQVNLSTGQYLAGDRGATVEISRRFDNGVAIGAYATKTNVSSAQFGEGSFDKGIFVSFPFDAILPRSSTASGTILWQPLLRDGGARLSRSQTLFGLTADRDQQAFSRLAATDGR